MNSLTWLANYKDQLSLAEAVGWLHDYRKCSDEHLKAQSSNPGRAQGLPRDTLTKQHKQLKQVELRFSLPFFPDSSSIVDLINDDRKSGSNNLLIGILERCHNTSHFDKQDLPSNYGKQNYPINPNDARVQISSPLGFEQDLPNDLTNKLLNLPWHEFGNYPRINWVVLQDAISTTFSQAVADTRRPINEVDLWSWGLMVGALYKSALAGAILTGNKPKVDTVNNKVKVNDLRWRLLSVRVAGLDYLNSAPRIPDLLARRDLLTDGLNRVKRLLEATYPLGSEVYRDENGSLFVVPDLPNLLEITDDGGTSLRELIHREFQQGTLENDSSLQIGGDLQVNLELETAPWWGQDPYYNEKTKITNSHLFGQAVNDQLPNVGALLSQEILSPAVPNLVEQFWGNTPAADACTVCGLRPRGPGKKALERNVCDICEKRRAGRSKRWACSGDAATIWTDEVADTNGRLALIVGSFNLTHWLDGTLISSLLLIPPHDPDNTENWPVSSKSPSFSRLRRIWETTHGFWREVEKKVLDQFLDPRHARQRLKIYIEPRGFPAGSQGAGKLDLAPFNVYDLELGSTSLSVVWVPPQGGTHGHLLSADNLGYVACQLGDKTGVCRHPAASAIFVEDHLSKHYMQNDNPLVLHNPDAHIKENGPNHLPTFRITRLEYQTNAYAPVIPILAEPWVFSMLVPADKALDIVKIIKEKYEYEMGKVRDRLPIHLGVVFATRRTPMYAVLDAGRAMLKYKSPAERWKIKTVTIQNQPVRGPFSEKVLLELEQGDRSIVWRIPLRMGDGSEDKWYPYLLLETDGDDSKADAASRRAAKINWFPKNGRAMERWIVHAADLRPGDVIYAWPSTFDFEFIDTASRRFAVYYDGKGRRPRRTRPFYLEDLSRLSTLWQHMKDLTTSQRYQVVRLIEATREAWFGADRDGLSLRDNVFQEFVADTLAGALWPEDRAWNKITDVERNELIKAGVRGELSDLAELHMEILKE